MRKWVKVRDRGMGAIEEKRVSQEDGNTSKRDTEVN